MVGNTQRAGACVVRPAGRAGRRGAAGNDAGAGGAVSGSLFQPDLIVDGLPQALLAAQVSLRSLH